jgi:Zn-dependent peptidase ImmA (M78 family)
MEFSAILELLNDIELIERPIKGRIKGFYGNDTIVIDKDIPTTKEKMCILAEELGHHYTSTGDISNLSKMSNRKQEQRARRWAVDKLIDVEDIIEAYNAGVQGRDELADYLNVTEEFIELALQYFQSLHGQTYKTEKYFINFNPLLIVRNFDTINDLR